MRIERIEIDGFGRFHDATWALGEGLTVLHGANEAGKTTLLNALRALLFGFEASRDGRTWYPALAGGRRGGRLVLRTHGGERWTVERHGERGGGGALAVRAPNGNQGGQETLERLLHGADRDLFNNIFAFGLGELQTFSSLSADAVRGRIYGAGAGLGGTSAIDLERRLRQQMDGTFLPRGRERALNQLLARIEGLRGEIADLARQPEEHADAHREREELRARAAELRDAVRDERERAARLGRLLDVRPAAVELAIVSAELETGDGTLDAMPPDAVAILERHLDGRSETRRALDAIDEELAAARAERAAIVPDEAVLANTERIAAVRDEQVARAAARDRRQEAEAAALRHAAAVAEQVTRTGMDEERLLALDDSIAGVERTRVLEQTLAGARSLAVETDRGERAAREELTVRERESVTAEDGADVVRLAAALEGLDALRLRRAVADARGGASLSPSLTWVIAAVAALAGLFAGVALGQPLVGALVGAAVAAGIVLAAARTGAAASPDRMDAERRELLEAADLPADADDDAVRSLAADVATRRARAGLAADQRAALEERRAELDRRRLEADAARTALVEAEGAWLGWLRSAGLPAELSPDAARQVLAAAGIARRAAAERDHQRAILDADRADEEAFAARVDALAQSLDGEAPAAAAGRDAFVSAVAARLQAAREAGRHARELDERIERLQARCAAARRTAMESEEALGSYLAGLGCEDADALRRRDAAAGTRRELVARLERVRARLAGAAGAIEAVDALAGEARAADPASLEADRADARGQVEQLEDEEREVLNRIGALDARIRQLEATEELGARRQELAALEGQAAALARDWAVRAVALRLLEETRSRYERERQPDVIRAATAHLDRVTGGRYSRIVAPPGDVAVRVETEGGEQRSTDELSRGTAEQLYLALRFGLIEEFARNAEPLPVVMDDILVNFDADRAARAAAAIRDLAARHQVLYFTCHAWTAELLDPDRTRTLALG